jgi:hypothetical protein
MIIHDLFSNFLFYRRARSLGDGNHRGGIEGGVEEGTIREQYFNFRIHLLYSYTCTLFPRCFLGNSTPDIATTA